jgi:hypothetical protein
MTAPQTAAQSPDEIRAEIERTRLEMQRDADRLTEKVSPSKVVERRVQGVRGALGGAKDKVLGTASSAASTGGSAAESVKDAATAAPHLAKQQTAGSPLLAGAVAFGVGYLFSALWPATQKEQQLAAHVQDVKEPVKETLTAAASEMKDELAPKATEAVQSVKESATSAAGEVKDTAASAAGEVKDAATPTSEADPYPATTPLETPPLGTVPPIR